MAAASALVLIAPVADAGACDNPCNIKDGELCLLSQPTSTPGVGVFWFLRKQRGTCGGTEPVPLATLELSSSKSSTGPFTPLKASEASSTISFFFGEPGVHFISAVPKDRAAAPLRRVIVSLANEGPFAPVRVRFLLKPPRGLLPSRIGFLLTYIPADVDEKTFPFETWPTWREAEWTSDESPSSSSDQGLGGIGTIDKRSASRKATKAARAFELPPGRYRLSWRHRDAKRPRHGVEVVEVRSAGDVEVALHPASE